jgi:hypothetical protein
MSDFTRHYLPAILFTAIFVVLLIVYFVANFA